MIYSDSVIFGGALGALSFLWCRVLTAPGHLGNIVPWLYWRALPRNAFTEGMAKPLFDCPLCNVTWLCWLFLLFNWLLGGGFFSSCIVFFSSALLFAYTLDRKYYDDGN